MVQKMKTKLCSLVRELGYNITDNGAYVDKFPWLMVRLSNHSRVETFDTRIDSITLTIDIFSKYKGEKEILDIVEDITNHIQTIRKDNPEVMYIAQKSLKILDDNKTGIVKKHGVLSYQFLLSSNPEEDENDDTEGD